MEKHSSWKAPSPDKEAQQVEGSPARASRRQLPDASSPNGSANLSRPWQKALAAAALLLLGMVSLLRQPATFLPMTALTSSKSGPVDWQPCVQDARFLCGLISIPATAHVPAATLALSLYPPQNTTEPSLGLIFTNPGGPGVEGRKMGFEMGPAWSAAFGGRHGILSLDQRGQGLSTPRVDCFGSARNHQLFKANTVLESTLSIPPDYASPDGTAVLLQQSRQADALLHAQGRQCAIGMDAEVIGNMGTTQLIKDIEFISAALEGEEAKINFFGGSYGSIVGQYLAAMLPHKAGKVVIDGIVPADKWAAEHYENLDALEGLLHDSELSLDNFLRECVEVGPGHCALAALAPSAPTLRRKIDTFLGDLYRRPLPVLKEGARSGVLTDGHVRQVLFATLQIPAVWKSIAAGLAAAIEDGDGTVLYELLVRPFSPDAPDPDNEGRRYLGQEDLTRLSVACADSPPYAVDEVRPTPEEAVVGLQAVLNRTSSHFGATVHLMEQHGFCQYWPGSGVAHDRFSGPFDVTLDMPMLVIGNVYDPVTPVQSAQDVKAVMGSNAHLLVQDSVGHSYLAPSTRCRDRVLRDFFVHGKLPDENETFCKRDFASPFLDESVGELSAGERLWIRGII